MRTLALIISVTIFAYLAYVCLMTYKQMVNGVRLVRMQVEGRELAFLIWGSGENDDVSYLSTCTNSTEALEYLSKKHSFAMGNRVKDGPFESVEEIQEFAPENNIWLIAKNLPSNAPEQIVVMATHNVNPEFLRTNFETNNLAVMPFRSLDREVGALDRYAVLVRKNGATLKIRKRTPLRDISSNKSTADRQQYEFLYDKPFDILDAESNKISLVYLTPTGEVNIPQRCSSDQVSPVPYDSE